MRRNVVQNSFFGTLGKLTIKVITFMFGVLVVRWLGDKDYGQYMLVWSFVIVFSIFSDAGLSMLAIREIAKDKPYHRLIITNIIVIRVILAILSSVVIVLSAWLIGYSAELIYYIFLASAILVLYAFQDSFDALLQAQERFDLSTTALVVGQLCFVGAGGLFLYLGWGITGLILAGLLNVAVAIILDYIFIRRCCNILDWTLQPRLWTKFLRNAFSFGLIKLWLTWLLKIDVVILSLFWMEEMVGWYSAAYTLVLGVMIISNAIGAALYPVMSRQYSELAPNFPQVYWPAIKYLLLISLLAASVITFTADKIVVLLFGAAFAPAAVALMILAWTIPLAFISELFRYVLMAINREKIAAYALGMAVIFSVTVNFIFIPRYGFIAAAIVAVATEFLLVLSFAWHLREEFKPADLVATLWKPALVTLGVVIVLSQAQNLPLVFELLIASILSLILIVILRVVNFQDYDEFVYHLRNPYEISPRSMANNPAQTNYPLVSVYIPAYNAAPYIEKAVNSVLTQTYSNYEIIIIDDCSTDNTWELLQQYQTHPRVTIYRHAENRGMAPTWNIGLSYARGEFISKLDADDSFEPDYLMRVIEFFRRNQDVGLVFSGVNLIYSDGRKESEMRYFSSRVGYRHDFLPTLLRLCIIRSPTVCVKKECFEQLGDFTEEMTIHADWEMWVRIAANYPVGYVARLLANYRIGIDSNVTSQAAGDGRSARDMKLWLDLLQKNQLPYQLTSAEEYHFRWGIYQLEMHFAAMAAHHQHYDVQQQYISFAESVLPDSFPATELEKMRQVYLDLHTGIVRFQESNLTEARRCFLRAIKTGPAYAKSLWVWNKLLLTFAGRTKWGILHK